MHSMYLFIFGGVNKVILVKVIINTTMYLFIFDGVNKVIVVKVILVELTLKYLVEITKNTDDITLQ